MSYIDKLPVIIEKKVKNFSKGMQRFIPFMQSYEYVKV